MSTDTIAVDVIERKTVKKGLNNLRSKGSIPAVIHNHGKESTHVQLDMRDATKVFDAAGKHHPVQVQLGGKKILTLIKDVDVDPIKSFIRHMVFQAIRQNEVVSAEIPLVLEGEIPAERQGLMLIRSIDYLEVEAKPNDLVDEISVDATSLAADGDKLTVADIKPPQGVTILNDPESTVAHIETPRDQIAAADESAAELAADAAGMTEEPEVLEEEQSEEDKKADTQDSSEEQ